MTSKSFTIGNKRFSYSKSTVSIAIAIFVAAVVIVRFYRITSNDFVFYDEGMYLGYNRAFLELVAANPPKNLQEYFIITGLIFKTALTTAKALWFYLLNLRVFVTGPEGYYVARLISAIAGIGVVGLSFMFARRYFKSTPVAVLTAIFLSILPSHVFYSRLGMQESFSGLLFLAGLYLFVFSKRGLSARLAWAALLMAAVYFTNYRMIVAPILIAIAQIWMDQSAKQKIDWQKLAVFGGIFAGMIIGIGLLDGGVNLYVNFGWMFHQAGESQAYRQGVNFLSFPYYVFDLEHPLFAIAFFANLALVAGRRTQFQLPFILTIAHMVLFSFAAEKGVRYLCVVLPLLAMSAAYALVYSYKKYVKFQGAVAIAIGLIVAGFLYKSIEIARFKTDYNAAIESILAKNPQAKIISTQPLVESLFLPNEKSIVALPKEPAQFAALIKQGYRYLVLDPQAYISWTDTQERFSRPLLSYVEFVRAKVSPVAEFKHMNKALLERFVLDHNQSLPRSLEFIRTSTDEGQIYIYDLNS